MGGYAELTFTPFNQRHDFRQGRRYRSCLLSSACHISSRITVQYRSRRLSNVGYKKSTGDEPLVLFCSECLCML